MLCKLQCLFEYLGHFQVMLSLILVQIMNSTVGFGAENPTNYHCWKRNSIVCNVVDSKCSLPGGVKLTTEYL